MSESPSDPHTNLPESIGDYQILDEIGAGGMGTVYLGRHRDTQEIAAVKLLPPALARDDGFRLRFQREIAALQQLNSPHIVQFRHHGEDLGSVYYSMEYVAGETLADRLRRERRLAWMDTIEIGRQLCIALKAAHDTGIIHRDLKPSNILLATDGRVKLSDFGIAQVFAADKLTLTGGVVGTAEYMSPEQAMGQRSTRRSDLYSLGAVLYVMLTGRPPYVGQTAVDIMHQHKYGQFDLPGKYVPEIPPDLEKLVAQLLEKDPDKRPPDAYVLLRRFDEILRKLQQSFHAQPTTSEERASITGRSHQSGNAGPGEATFMRDLIRSELTRPAPTSTVARGFDNVWVLLGLLTVVIGGVGWLATRAPSDQQRLTAGLKLLEQPPGPEWLQARDQYLLPLLAKDPDTWNSQLQKPLAQIELYSLEQKLLNSRKKPSAGSPMAEIERQLRLARRDWDAGEAASALRRLEAVQLLWKSDAEATPYRAIAERWAEDWTAQMQDWANPRPWIERQLEVAREEQSTAPATAQQRRAALRELYASDPRVRDLLLDDAN